MSFESGSGRVQNAPQLAEAVSVSMLLKINPPHLSDAFWQGFADRVWVWHDACISACTLGFVPLMYHRSPHWCLAAIYIVVYALKALHLSILYSSTRRAAVHYDFNTRNLLVILERLLRMTASYFTGRDWDKHAAKYSHLLAKVSGSSAGKLELEVVKHLVIGTGSTVLLWHTFCLPTVWALEPLLLLPLLLMTLYGRGPPTAAFLASLPPNSGVHAAKRALGALCSRACRAALVANHSASAVCEMGAPAGPGGSGGLQYDLHLTGTLIIFAQYLLPLYLRYMQESAVKLQFLWARLGPAQQPRFLVYHKPSSRWLGACLSCSLHLVVLTSMLALSLVLGRLAALHLMPLRLRVLVAEGLLTLPPAE